MAAITALDTLEGIIEDVIWFHYDLGNDVLYFRYSSLRGLRLIGDEEKEGTLFYTEDNRLAGMTVIYFWKRYGTGSLQEASCANIQDIIAQFVHANFLLKYANQAETKQTV